MVYDQVKDMDLLEPYLEAQGINSISELPSGTGTPPTDDPQIFLGSLSFSHINTPENPLSTPSTIHYAFLVTAFCPQYLQLQPNPIHTVAMSNSNLHPKSHYKCNPNIHQCSDGLIVASSGDLNYIFHLFQLAEFLKFDTAVCRRDPSVRDGIPIGYPEFANFWNLVKDADNPCEFVVYNNEAGAYTINTFSVPPSILSFPFIDPCYAELRAYDVINARGDLNPATWSAMKNALLCPHREAQRNQSHKEQRREKQESKKCRLEEALPEAILASATSNKTAKTRGKGKTKDTNHIASSSQDPLTDADAPGKDDNDMIRDYQA
ncbi:hypothetical protein C0991_012299 [Blastosporella zonata]|nr:hypothetical protein C0991_012299 [Blastosporella zonata]